MVNQSPSGYLDFSSLKVNNSFLQLAMIYSVEKKIEKKMSCLFHLICVFI